MNAKEYLSKWISHAGDNSPYRLFLNRLHSATNDGAAVSKSQLEILRQTVEEVSVGHASGSHLEVVQIAGWINGCKG